MALKPDREVHATRIDFYLNEVAEEGTFVSFDTAGSGVAMDHGDNLVTVADAASGSVPVGLLMSNTVDIDETVYPLTRQGKDIVPVGGKVAICSKGWFVTDKVDGDPAVGEPAILGPSGTVTPGAAGSDLRVGRFLSSKDEAGFAKVEVDL